MGRGKGYETIEYILRTIQYDDEAWTRTSIVNYIQGSFSKTRSISKRSIDKALSILRESGIIKKENRDVMKFFSKRKPENKELWWMFMPVKWPKIMTELYVIDWQRVSRLISKNDIETFVQAVEERGHTVSQQALDALNDYLARKSQFTLEQSKERLQYEAQLIEDAGRYWDIIQLYIDEQNANRAIKAFKIWKKLELEKGGTLGNNLT